ncbi:MAG: hypothetical protein KAH38_03050 [Candidatus Hydrogenedentes bacterium]|nr:hypothetical protein [Candidatus Hydrogenedentota bacterium]
MTENKNTIVLWTIGTLLVWLVVFMIGLFPEIAFRVFREAGYVVTMRALINSHWFITLACSTFLGWFTFKRCAECDDPVDAAFGKSIQVMILAITAFLPLEIEKIGLYFLIPILFYRYLILSVIAVKILAWLYLVTLLLQYYLISGHTVFKNIPLLFPSVLLLREDPPPATTADTELPKP